MAPSKCPSKWLKKLLSHKKKIMSCSFLNSGTLIVILDMTNVYVFTAYSFIKAVFAKDSAFDYVSTSVFVGSEVCKYIMIVNCVYSFSQAVGPQSTHRVAVTGFWRTFHHDGKISPGWWGCGVNAHPISLYSPSRTKLQCMLQLRGQVHSPYFISTLYSVGKTDDCTFHELPTCHGGSLPWLVMENSLAIPLVCGEGGGTLYYTYMCVHWHICQ